METEVVVAIAVAGVAIVLLALVLWRRATRRGLGTEPGNADASMASAPSGWASLRTNFAVGREGLLARLRSAWGSTSQAEGRLGRIEEVLLTADVGVKTTQRVLDAIRGSMNSAPEPDTLQEALRIELRSVLGQPPSEDIQTKPHVVVVAGVNGVGKTTTIGKLANRYKRAGKSVLLVAADTFRAAASEQLQIWAARVGVDCVHHQSGADPSAVAFDGLAAAAARDIDVVIVDTAGRLHVKQHLVDELKKIVRIIGRQCPGAPHEALLVIDATTGQNAISQARVFQEAIPLTGIVLTKLDGTAKGGVVFAIRADLGLPIKYVGLGETIEDLELFDPDAFLDALLDSSS